MTHDPTTAPAVRPQEQLLIEALDRILGHGPRLLTTTAGYAQLGLEAAAREGTRVTTLFLDSYVRAQAIEAIGAAAIPENLELLCAEDFPEGEVDAVALPLSASGEGELVRDHVQAALLRLRIGGLLAVSTDNRGDSWLGKLVHEVSKKVVKTKDRRGAVYLVEKTQELRKVKDYTCEFAFRDRGQLIKAVSRPGVFAHRRIDPGARHLINAMEVADDDRVLDVGCGSGVVSLAAASRAERVSVHAIDSHARAVGCTRGGAERNALTSVTAALDYSGETPEPGSFQLALANPPYYAAGRIARHFLEVARKALAPGGTVLVVTKTPEWYSTHMPELFDEVEVGPAKEYHVARGTKRV